MESIYKLSETSMDKETCKFNQGDSAFIKFFFDLFYRINWDPQKEEYFKIQPDFLPPSEVINVLICGAGSCVHELPVLLTLFDKYKNVNLTFVDKATEPFKLLHFILQKYGETGSRDSIVKDRIANYFSDGNNTKDNDIITDKTYSICDNKINYSFHVMDLELDPHEFVKDSESDAHENATNKYKEFIFFNDKKYDIVMMSMFLQHISYWRSLIALLNDHLEKGGYFWINELGKDDYLLTLDLYMAIIDNKRKSKKVWLFSEKNIIQSFESNKDKDQMLFSIISDNDEISPTNTEICRDFFDFLGSKREVVFEEEFQSDMNPFELFKEAKNNFSPFAKLQSFIGDETLSPNFDEQKSNEKLDFTMTWYAYKKVEGAKIKQIKHFNVLDDVAMDVPDLQHYISRTLDILNLNSTIFRPTFLRRKDTSEKMVKFAIDLFRRFQLFKIGDFHSIVFYIPDIITVECFNDTKKNYINNFTEQREFINKRIRPYNNDRKEMSGEESNSSLFFDKYKSKMTKPFSIIYEPLVAENVNWERVSFVINEYDHSPNRKVHIIRVEGIQDDSQVGKTIVTPLGVNYNLSSLRKWYKAYHEHFKEYRSIFIPCFREPLFDQNKEFLGDFIIFQEEAKGYKQDGTLDYTPIVFFSWLIRKFIDFTQIATYLDYKRIILQSLKSAISAIMSRNMSHNLGSHYLYYTKNQLLALADKHDEVGPEIRGAAKVMGYMQARMDYLATIVSGDKYPYGSVFFKGQIFDELTVDDFSKRHFKEDKNDPNRQYKRTTNYLLQNLILSENFTRGPVIDGHLSPLDSNGENKKNKILKLKVIFQGYEFTGNSVDAVADSEETIKLAVSKISTAMPGGIMSIHAFYNVLENLIRNSAKYLKEDLKEELVFTIAIREIAADLEKSLPERYEFVIFDNKANALLPISRQGEKTSFQNVVKTFLGKSKEMNKQTLIGKMTNELMGIKILKDNNELDKSNKGLKEIFFSTLWMRAYTYKKSKHMSDILAEIESLEGKEKLDEIRTHAFEYVAVDDMGNVKNGEDGASLNLGIRFELPKFRMMENVSAEKLTDNLIEKGLNNFTDILCVNSDYLELASLKTQFTRVYPHLAQNENSEEEAVSIFKKILSGRFDDFEKYRLCMQSEQEDGFDDCDKKKYGIYFENHFADKNRMNDYSYIEAISGENYTKTMQSIFNNSIIGGVYNNEDKSAEYFGLKIKEAALTRITLIDERLYNDMLQNNRGWQLELKNIRVLNLKENDGTHESLMKNFFNSPSMKVKQLFDGNNFRDGSDATHFLSIHLGMIEKIVKDDSSWIKTFHLEKANLDDRVNKLMSWIKDTFKTSKGEVFVSIHSGRGNYSPDLDASLRHYPFISISAIESVYNNAKFLLAQLFYNTVYIGKGVTNG